MKNLPFTCMEEELTSLFATYGPLNSVHIALDKEKKSSKGFGFVQFMIPEHADTASKQLTGSAFQGRLLHIVPAKKAPQREQSLLSDLTLGDRGRKLSSFQEKKEVERRLNFNKKQGWNSTFVRSDAVVDSLAERFDFIFCYVCVEFVLSTVCLLQFYSAVPYSIYINVCTYLYMYVCMYVCM